MPTSSDGVGLPHLFRTTAELLSMLWLARRIGFVTTFRTSIGLHTTRHSSTSTKHDALRVLFCGADAFSIYSLRALRELQGGRPDKIASIDVVCRPDKRVGRGLKQIQEVPIKRAATDLGLDLHQIDTFKDWSPPKAFNLVIAVSFGLLVPARILTAMKYGGLNVHPSLLPDLRGPAPMIHTLLKRRSHTGVTLQTMHPTRFDHGTVLAQTSSSEVPVPDQSTPDDLVKILGPLGAEMLCHGIENALFVPPLKDVRHGMSDSLQLDYAPKVTPEDRQVNWSSWTSDEILLRDRVLGRLWDVETYSRCFPDRSKKRITFHGPWDIHDENSKSTTTGGPHLIPSERPKSPRLAFRTLDGKLVSPAAATLEGESKGQGLAALIHGLRASEYRH